MLNDFVAVGRLGAPLEMKYFESGAVIASGSFAVSRIGKDAPTDWLKVKFLGGASNSKLPERAASTLRKGSQIVVVGSLDVEQWKDKSTGETRQNPAISARSFSYADAKEGEKSPQIKGVNHLVLAAALASPVELRRAGENNLSIATFKLSLSQRNEEALIDCICFGKAAEQMASSRAVGEMLIVQGEVRVNSEEGRSKTLQIRADSVVSVSALVSGERLAPPPATRSVPDYSLPDDEPGESYDDIPF